MAKERKLTLTILGNAKGALGALTGVGAAGDNLGSKLGGLTKKAGLAFVAMGAGAAVMGKKFVDAASNLNESMGKVNVVFGDSAKQVQDFAKKSAAGLGISQQKALEAAGTYGNLTKAFGLTNQQATDMSINMVTLAADLASFNNTSVDDALLALRSGLSGETEPLKKFGIALNDTRLKEEALRMGLIETTSGTLPIAIKTQAAYALIMKDSALAQGDFERTSDGVANKQRIISAQFADVSAQIGTALLPAFQSILGVVGDKVLPLLAGFGTAMQTGGFSGGIDFIVTKVKELAPKLLQALGELITNVVSWVSTDGKALLIRGFNFLSNALTQWVLPALPKLITTIVQFLTRVYQWIATDGVDLLTKGAIKLGDAIVGWVMPMIPKLLDALKKYAKEIVTFLVDVALPNLVANVQKLGDKLVSWIGEAARTLPAQLVTFLGELAGWLLANAVPKILELGMKLLISLLKWTVTLGKDLIIGIGGAIVALVAALPDLFVGLVVGMGKIAVNLVEFFIDKFKMLGGKIAEIAVGAVNFLIDKFNSIPLIPNIDKVTLDMGKLQTSMKLSATDVAKVATSMNATSNPAAKFSTSLEYVKTAAKGATTATEGLNTTLGAGSGSGKGTKKALDDAATQLKKYTSALQTNKEASRSSIEATKGVTNAKNDLQKAVAKVSQAQKDYNLVINGFPRTSKEAIEATKQLDQANRRLRDSNLSQGSAVRGVIDAEKRLADLRKITSDPKTVAEAERNLTRAKFSLEQANFDVIDSEKELAELRISPDSNPTEIRKKEIGLAEAKLRVIEATLGQQDAHKLLDDERNRAAKPEDIADAERELEAAKLSVVDAIDDTRDATIEQAVAQALLDEIVNGAKEGSDAYKKALDVLNDARDDEVEAIERVEEALYRELEAVNKLAEAQRELDELRKQISKSVIAQGDKQFELNNAGQVIAQTVNPTKTDTNTSGAGAGFDFGFGLLTPSDIEEINKNLELIDLGDFFGGIDFGGFGTLMGDGGIVKKATSIIAGERGAEAIIPLDRMGSRENTYNITVTAGMGADGKDIGTQIVNALKRYERTNGALPLTVQ